MGSKNPAATTEFRALRRALLAAATVAPWLGGAVQAADPLAFRRLAPTSNATPISGESATKCWR
jgi:hypothetical protein